MLDYTQTFTHAIESLREQQVENLEALVAEREVGSKFTLGYLAQDDSGKSHHAAQRHFRAYAKATGHSFVEMVCLGAGGKHADSGVQFVGIFRRTTRGLLYYEQELRRLR